MTFLVARRSESSNRTRANTRIGNSYVAKKPSDLAADSIIARRVSRKEIFNSLSHEPTCDRRQTHCPPHPDTALSGPGLSSYPPRLAA